MDFSARGPRSDAGDGGLRPRPLPAVSHRHNKAGGFWESELRLSIMGLGGAVCQSFPKGRALPVGAARQSQAGRGGTSGEGGRQSPCTAGWDFLVRAVNHPMPTTRKSRPLAP